MAAPLPHAPASERNRDPILAVLRRHFADRRAVLEIGSGTGQHAAYFAAALPQLRWQPSDLPERLPGIAAWREAAGTPNLLAPCALDVMQADWPCGPFDAVFTANTFHIMPLPAVATLFDRLPRVLAADACMVVYGPFHHGGRPTSDSNAAFDAGLRSADPEQGVRDFEAIEALAEGAGFALVEDVAMPANNRCLVWRRAPAGR